MQSILIYALVNGDVIEDTRFTAKDIKEMFGNEIALIVEGVANLQTYLYIATKKSNRWKISEIYSWQ